MSNKICLLTDDNLVDEVPLSEYPRPQFKRNSYLCLNGSWDFKVSSKDNDFISPYHEKIIVPFVMESFLSSINRELKKGEYIYYRRELVIPSGFNKGRLILHFDGIDQISEVYINGQFVSRAEGGYLPFEVDISDYIQDVNIIEVKVKDDLDYKYGYGKQTFKSHGMWYTKSSGIWKSVWLESVPNLYFDSIKILTTLNLVSLKLFTNIVNKKIIIHTEYGDIIKEFVEDEVIIEIPNPHHWTPEDPYLYYFELIGGDDHIESYFALRTIQIAENKPFILLNNKPYFFHGLLDQGYFPDGLLTPKTYQKYEDEIVKLKQLGFNTLRKHIKVEPLYFYYLCDKLGMVVFQDMVNNSPYSFIRDTMLPTLGFLKWKNKGKYVKKSHKEQFIKECLGTIELLFNCPCVLYYTIFNEGWGQFDSDKLYKLVKEKDATRIVDTTSGWFFGTLSDVDSYHVYFKKIKKKVKTKPLIISEFGGYVYKDKEHSFNLDKTYGYKIYKTIEEFRDGLEKLYLLEIIPNIVKGYCGAIYTQVSDVEDETNGLFTYDRKVLKVEEQTMRKIALLIQAEVNKIKI